MADPRDYVARAVARIREVLDEQGAVVQPELVARLSEHYYRDHPDNIDPHHVTTALRELRERDEIVSDWTTTKGGHTFQTLQPANRHRRATRIDAAAATKRALYARYAGWSQGTKRHPQGLIGPAGEHAVRSGILASYALQPAAPGAGEVASLLGVELPGPADSAGYLVPFQGDVPAPAVTLIFEVKNIRSWIYPNSEELHQVLDKACLLQRHRPSQAIVPILVCRRAHITTFWMAKQLGFIVIEAGRQWAGNVTDEEVLEIRNGLHFEDLHAGADPSLRVRDRLAKTMPKIATQVAVQWAGTCAINGIPERLPILRSSATTNADREYVMLELRDIIKQAGYQGGW